MNHSEICAQCLREQRDEDAGITYIYGYLFDVCILALEQGQKDSMWPVDCSIEACPYALEHIVLDGEI